MKKLFIILILLFLISLPSCNLFYVAVRNVPTFFSSPKKVYNKIKEPVKPDVKLSALWIGHSTVLLQMYDKVIITDPLLTETMGELGRRVVEPGLDPENIPPCDLIVISHPHFDHLNFPSLGMIEDISSKAAIVFPYGLEEFLPDYKFKFCRMKNADGYRNHKYIGETKEINGLTITTVFAQHWGGRYALDGYLWGNDAFTGFIIQYKDLTVYFAGDTGYDSTAFKYLSTKFSIDLALIPIGPCADCNQPGTRNHVFPPESIQVFNDLGAGFMIPIHYGTLHFAQADPEVPLETFRSLVAENNLNKKVYILKIGGQEIFVRL